MEELIPEELDILAKVTHRSGGRQGLSLLTHYSCPRAKDSRMCWLQSLVQSSLLSIVKHFNQQQNIQDETNFFFFNLGTWFLGDHRHFIAIYLTKNLIQWMPCTVKVSMTLHNAAAVHNLGRGQTCSQTVKIITYKHVQRSIALYKCVKQWFSAGGWVPLPYPQQTFGKCQEIILILTTWGRGWWYWHLVSRRQRCS